MEAPKPADPAMSLSKPCKFFCITVLCIEKQRQICRVDYKAQSLGPDLVLSLSDAFHTLLCMPLQEVVSKTVWMLHLGSQLG